MGTLIPRDLSVRSLPNEAERRVVEALRDGLSDAWLIIPNVAIRGRQRDYEIDVVLLHSTYGIVVIEVKGHDVEIREGRWYSHGSLMEPQPLDQARTNAYALRDLIRAELPDLQHLRVEYGVALPNTSAIEGRLPPGVDEVQVATAPRLDDVSRVRRGARVLPVDIGLAHARAHRGDRRDPLPRRQARLGRWCPDAERP